MVHVNISSTNFNKSMNNAYTPSVCMIDKKVQTKCHDPKDDYSINLDDSSDEEEINQAVKTFKNITRMQIKNVLEKRELLDKDTSEHLVEGKSVLLHSLGRIYFNVPFNNEYQELKSKFFKKATIPPEKREILDNYKTEPNRSNRENRKQIQRKIDAERPTFEYTKKNILMTIQPLQQQLITQKLINRNETRLSRNENFGKKDIIYNNHITVTYKKMQQGGLFSKGYAGGEGILKDFEVKEIKEIRNGNDIVVIQNGSYEELNEVIEKLKINNKNKTLATKILTIAKNGSKPGNETPEKILSEYLYMLLLTVEPSRSPVALINNIQILELIDNGKMTFKEAFVGEKNNTPMMPMAAPEIVKTSTTLQRKYVYNDNFVYPCHYLPHTAFGINQFTKEKNESYPVENDQLTDLQQKESNILDKWLKMKIGQYLAKNNEQVEEDNHVVNEELVDEIFEQINSDKDKSNYIDIVVEEIEATMRKYGLGVQGLEVDKETKLKQIVKNMNKQSQSKKQIKV